MVSVSKYCACLLLQNKTKNISVTVYVGGVLPFLQEWQITRLSHEYDSEPFGKERDAAIQKLACEAGVEVIVRISHTLYNLAK